MLMILRVRLQWDFTVQHPKAVENRKYIGKIHKNFAKQIAKQSGIIYNLLMLIAGSSIGILISRYIRIGKG